MAEKKSLLKWLRRFWRRGPQPEKGQQSEIKGLRRAKDQRHVSDAGVAQTEGEAAAPAKAASDPLKLNFAPNHAIHRLWQLRNDQAGWQPSPLFRFEGADGGTDIIPAQAAQKELARLLLTVNSSANQRVAKATPKDKNKSQTTEDEQKPEAIALDAQAVAYVAGDRMTAWIFAYPPVGEGRELDKAMLLEALAAKQVGFGVDEALLERLPDEPERYFHLYLAAQGKPVVHGKDGRVVDMFSRYPERKLAVDEYNRVDYASLSFIQNAQEGDVICRIIPPVEGEAGMTVLGQELPPKAGKKPVVPKGRNTELSEDGSKLVATKTGHLEFNGRTFQIRPVYDVDGNVDYDSGNINFLGDVHVHGDVCTGFTVRAMGNITVDGVAEACTIEAGGDLILVKGAQGDNRAVLRSSHSIYAKYLENCCVYAMENIQADCIINCEVYCDGEVEVRSGRGTIVGGSIRAAHTVEAEVLGSRSECRTDIVLGGLPCQAFDHTILVREISDMEEELAKLERQPESPTKFSRMGKLRMQLSVNKNKLSRYDRDLLESEESTEPPGIRRLRCDVAYPGATVTIDQTSYRFRQETRPVNARLVEGEISLI